MEDGQVSRDYRWFIHPSEGAIARDWVNVENGLIPLEELDDAEISRIQLRDVNGQFRGRKPFVSRRMATEFRRELIKRADLKVQERTLEMFEVIADVATSAEATGSEKTRAAQYLIERALGKVPDKVEVTAEVKPWEGTVMGILQDVEEERDGAGETHALGQ